MKEVTMSTYTDELQKEVERVTLKGNADKETIRRMASIIFRMDQRIQVLEGEVSVDDKPAAPPAQEEVKEVKETKSARRVSTKSE